MKLSMKLSIGDILIDRKTHKQYPIVDIDNGHAYLELGHRLAKRAFGQIIRHRKKFIHLKVGQKIEQDLVFYCNKKNKMITLEAGTVFMGEL